MDRWIDVAGIAELPPGARCTADDDGLAIAVFNLDGEYFAIENSCTHDRGELAEGETEGDQIICPRHGARFSLRTGAVLSPPAYENLRIFPVRIVQGRILVGVG